MLIDTAHAKQFSVAGFEQVSVGMSRAEVEQRIGKRVSDYTSGTRGVDTMVCERQTNDGALRFWDFAWYNATICYDANDRVVSVNGYWQED